jgi:hypothetical protein
MDAFPPLRGTSLLLVSCILLVTSVFNDPPWKWYSASLHISNSGEPAHVVASLLHNGSFANPFAPMDTGPTAHVAPAFPFLQFLLIKIFGSGAPGWLALRCVPTIAFGLQLALLPYFGRIFGYSPWTGVLAAVFGLIVKPGKEELWEAHLAGLLCLLLAALFCRWMQGPRCARMAWAIGLLAGAAMLLQPVFALVYFAWLAWMTFKSADSWRSVAPLWSLPFAICAPWMIRNFVMLGTPAIRDNLGLELYVSFNDCAPYGVRQSERQLCSTVLHPNDNLAEAAEVRRLGEYEYNRDRLHRALQWIAAHPSRSASLVAQRFWFFWFPSDYEWRGYFDQRKRIWALHAMTLASIAGLILAFRRAPAAAYLFTLWLAAFPLIYYVVQFEARYRYPILWITWLLAAYAMNAFAEALG